MQEKWEDQNGIRSGNVTVGLAMCMTNSETDLSLS